MMAAPSPDLVEVNPPPLNATALPLEVEPMPFDSLVLARVIPATSAAAWPLAEDPHRYEG